MGKVVFQHLSFFLIVLGVDESSSSDSSKYRQQFTFPLGFGITRSLENPLVFYKYAIMRHCNKLIIVYWIMELIST